MTSASVIVPMYRLSFSAAEVTETLHIFTISIIVSCLMFILGYYYFGSSKSESVISLHFACSCSTIYKVVVRLI